jgi:hypothetical protein
MRTIIKCIILFGCLAPGLSAQEMRLTFGYWPGVLRNELENRFRQDDGLLGETPDRMNLEWVGKETEASPLGLHFLLPMGPGKLMFGGNFISNRPDYKYASLTSQPSLSLVMLEDFSSTSYEGEIGFEFEVTPFLLYITPRVGMRQHFQEFNYRELTIGEDSFMVALDSPWYSQARSAYGGLSIQYFLSETVSLLLDGTHSPPMLSSWGGHMDHERIVAGRFNNQTRLTFDRAEAGYEISISRGMFGLQFDASDEIHFKTGYREELQRVRYPGYYNLPLIVQGDNIDFKGTVLEFMTDYVIYNTVQTTRKGFMFFEVSLDIHLTSGAGRERPGRGGPSPAFERDFNY